MLCVALSSIAGSLRAAPAAAADTPYCQQVKARAASDADLLMAPRVLVTGLRFPKGAQQLDSGATTSQGFQLRTGFAFSPVDFYKGQTLLRVGEADCARHAASVELDALLTRGTDDARLSALNEQAQFLRTRSGQWRTLQTRAAERLSQRIITVVEFSTVQRFIDTLEHKLVQVEGEAHQLAARRPRVAGLPSPAPAAALRAEAPSLPSLANRYFETAMRFEQHASELRGWDAWKLQLSGGVIPQTPVDWYGAVELSFSLGGLIRTTHEEQYLHARARALREASDGVDARIEAFRSQASAVLGQARRDLGLVQHSLDVIRATRSALMASEADSVAHARDMLAIEQMSIESDSVYLKTLVMALESLVARARG